MVYNRIHPVDPARRRLYYPPLRTVRVLALLGVIAACAPRPAPAGASPAAPDSALVTRTEAATRPQRLLHVTFDWSMQDRDARFSGRGVVRLAPPYRGRLDLFGPRGETYLAAVMQDEDLTIVPAAAATVLPPAAFLWSSLGVFRRPDRPLTGTSADGSRVTFVFGEGRERWQFILEGERLRNVEWLGTDGGRRTVALEGAAAHGLPQRGTYRDWQEFRELTLTLTSVEEVDAFPADIWRVGAR